MFKSEKLVFIIIIKGFNLILGESFEIQLLALFLLLLKKKLNWFWIRKNSFYY